LIVVASDKDELWLHNPTASDIQCSAFEVFGFNVATYLEKPAGMMTMNYYTQL
jgi:hypothetical protein